MRAVSIVGIGQIPVRNTYETTLRSMGADVVQLAMSSAGIDHVDALYVGNMLSDELLGQKHLAALIADEARLAGAEALQIRAATASGAAALRVAFLAVASGAVDIAVAAGAEKMSAGVATPILAKALDAVKEVPDGATLISQNAHMMQCYIDEYNPPKDAFAQFSVNAHENARHNPIARFQGRQYTPQEILASRVIVAPLRLLDCSPICDGAAAVVLASTDLADHFTDRPIRILASSVATDRFRIADRENCLSLQGVHYSAEAAFHQAKLRRDDISLFELHDAFSIIACLSLEASGFAKAGQGWKLAAEGEIGIHGRIPITTMGGLKARGHPIGATALYQTCEIVLQLTGRAGKNQVPSAEVALMQSIGGVASTVITHIFSN